MERKQFEEIAQQARAQKKTKVVDKYKLIQTDKDILLQRMEDYAKKGWKVVSFGWSPLDQGSWYALLVRNNQE